MSNPTDDDRMDEIRLGDELRDHPLRLWHCNRRPTYHEQLADWAAMAQRMAEWERDQHAAAPQNPQEFEARWGYPPPRAANGARTFTVTTLSAIARPTK